jgi:hypothetical protein
MPETLTLICLVGGLLTLIPSCPISRDPGVTVGTSRRTTRRRGVVFRGNGLHQVAVLLPRVAPGAREFRHGQHSFGRPRRDPTEMGGG